MPCDTNPLVAFGNITLTDVSVHNAILPPGIIRCDKTSPCTDFRFDNVNADGWWNYLGINYITENVFGTIVDSHPVPAFVTPEGDGFVGNNNLEQILLLLWSSLMGLFSPTEDEPSIDQALR